MTDRELTQRITNYLTGGGLFNPEMANHEAVRDLLIDCRDALAQPEQKPVAVMQALADNDCAIAYADGWNACVQAHSRIAALAQPEQEPVAWMLPDYRDVLSASEADGTGIYSVPLYTTPPRKPWVGLTDDEIKKIVDLNTSDDGGFDIWCDGIAVAHIVCAKLKEKNA